MSHYRDLAAQHQALRTEFASIRKTFFSICRGEIVNAAFVALGHSSTSNLSKAGFFQRIKKEFFGYFHFARKSLPDLSEDEFKGMLRVINPSQENYHINARNAAAHRVTLSEARESAADDEHPHLLRWVDLMAAWERDQQACITDVAFKNACPSSTQMVERYELASTIMAWKNAPEELRSELIDLMAEHRQKMEAEDDDDALLKASGVEFAVE